MEVALPSMDDRGLASQTCTHFGQTPFFTIVDTQTSTATAVANPGHQGDRTPAQAVAETGVEVIVCGGMGHRAVHLLADLGLQTFLGAQGTVQDAIDAWQQGKLAPASDEGACPGH